MNNKMEQVAQMLEVEIGEMFRIEGSNVLHRLSEQGGEWFDDNTQRWSVDGCILNYLLVDGMKIIKQPWKPKVGEKYYSPIVNDGPVRRIIYVDWDNDDVDKRRYKNGFVFKTLEEAEEMAEKIAEFVLKERGLK